MKKTLLWYPGIAAAGGLLFAVCEQIEDHILHDFDFLKAAMFVIAVLTAAAARAIMIYHSVSRRRSSGILLIRTSIPYSLPAGN